MINRDTLKKYAEFGVRERLREIQRELEVLAKDFPQLVRNQDGTMPSVLPLELKLNGNGNGHQNGNGHGGRVSFRTMTDQLQAYLTKHPGASTQEIAAAVGLTPSTGLRTHLSKFAKGKPTGPTGSKSPVVWTLKTSTRAATGPRPKHGHTATVKAQRARSATILATFSRETPSSGDKVGRGLGSLVRRGYLRKQSDGYVRTAKEYQA